MQVVATISPITPEALRQQCGGEMGVTLYVAGVQIFVPESACVEDLEFAIDGLTRLKDCGGYVRNTPQISDGAGALPDN